MCNAYANFEEVLWSLFFFDDQWWSTLKTFFFVILQVYRAIRFLHLRGYDTQAGSMGTNNPDIQTMRPPSKIGNNVTDHFVDIWDRILIQFVTMETRFSDGHTLLTAATDSPPLAVLQTSGDSHPPTSTPPMFSLCFGSVRWRNELFILDISSAKFEVSTASPIGNHLRIQIFWGLDNKMVIVSPVWFHLWSFA